MNDLPRQELGAILAKQGLALLEDPKQCEALLKEKCGSFKREVRVLIGALQEGIPGELLALLAGVSPEVLHEQLAQRLEEELALSAQAARWAVEAWAAALAGLSLPDTRTTSQAQSRPSAEIRPQTETAPRVVEIEPVVAPAEPDIEQPACFYLGREYDLASRKVLKQPVMYEARHLTTHGVVVGMTGSGKTGLCISLLEEAAIDGIPCILIDPKGDLTNLLLNFADLNPKDFGKWLNPEDARQKGLSLEAYARQLSETWRKGLADWGQTPERIARLRDSAEWRIYTPGSEAGLPLSIIQTFAAPRGNLPREALNEKIDATATALLGLTGLSNDPVQSREHILIAQLLLHAWSVGRDLDLAQLITQIQAPPLRKIGAFDVDTFYPEKDRLKLAVALNNLLASPSFSTWITGEPLDLSTMLYSGNKPRQLIFYIAHLEESQRVFFLTLLLEEVLSWTRSQPGTTSLRAIVYFDEVYGYLPPYPANPPTKTPLMTMLKQARAFGVGVLLATQNPVDLDYKALSNAGTWFVGKLQTERDKARLLEGLEGVAAERGTLMDRSYLETVISALGNRVFLLHNVHQSKPLLFQSRWALSFLRGPLTREHVATLMGPLKEGPAAEPGAGRRGAPEAAAPLAAIPLCPHCRAELPTLGADVCPACGQSLPRPASALQDQEFKARLRQDVATTPVGRLTRVPPALPAGIAQYYLPVVRPAGAGREAILVYQARMLALAEVVFADKRKGIERLRQYRLLAEPPRPNRPVAWAAAESIPADVAPGPAAIAHWGDIPAELNSAKKLKGLEHAFVEFLYSNARLSLFSNRALDLFGEPGEDVVAFRERCRAKARKQADKALTEERAIYGPKFDDLEAKLVGSTGRPRSAGGSGSDWRQFAASLLDFFPLWGTNRPPPPARKVAAQRASPASAKSRAQRAKLVEAKRKLLEEWEAKVAALAGKWQQAGEEYSVLELRPRKADVRIIQFGLVWAPLWHVTTASGLAESVPAYQRDGQ
jgi:hypothetical protein